MAQQTINNGEQYGSIRTKLNSMFGELYSLVTSLGTSVTSLTSSNTILTNTVGSLSTTADAHASALMSYGIDIDSLQSSDVALDSRLDSIEALDVIQNGRLTSIEDIGLTNVTATAPLTVFTATTTPTKLTFFNSIALQVGAQSTASIPNQSVTINTAGVYKISGNLIVEFSQADEMSVQLYKNSVAFTPSFHQQGLGAGKPVNIGYTACMTLAVGDVITLYVTSNTSSFSAIVDGASVMIEKTHY